MSSAEPSPGLYIHIPFCKTKCPYCDFYSITNEGLISSFVKAFRAEALLYRDRFLPFDSLYFGGGTPSCIGETAMEELFGAVRTVFKLTDDIEITIEMNPDDVTEKVLDHYRKLGVNRISLGIQALDDKSLTFLGRRHGASGAKKSIALVKEAGFSNFSIDLIYGLPHQTEHHWLKTLEEACSFGPAHLSCYELTIHEATPFAGMLKKGTLKPTGEAKQRRLFLATSRFLTDHGFIHYEVSNFACSKKLRSRHNLKYWRHAPYLGLGPSAHSFLYRKRWWNTKSVEEYCGHLTKGRPPVEGKEILSQEQTDLERLFLGLRNAEGVDIDSITPQEGLKKAIDKLVSQGLVEVHRGRIVPTIKGYLLADRLPLLLSP